eukprot:jgi/Hompol1/2176/HPOL_001434-RA
MADFDVTKIDMKSEDALRELQELQDELFKTTTTALTNEQILNLPPIPGLEFNSFSSPIAQLKQVSEQMAKQRQSMMIGFGDISQLQALKNLPPPASLTADDALDDSFDNRVTDEDTFTKKPIGLSAMTSSMTVTASMAELAKADPEYFQSIVEADEPIVIPAARAPTLPPPRPKTSVAKSLE